MYYDSHQVAQILNTITADVSTIRNWDFVLVAVSIMPFMLFFVLRFKREVNERLRQLVHDDWEHSYPLDLSGKGIYEDLEKIAEEGSENER